MGVLSFQSAKVVFPTMANIAAGASGLLTFTGPVQLVVVDNQLGAADIYMNFNANTIVPAATATWYEHMCPAGIIREYYVNTRQIAMYANGGDIVLVGTVGVKKTQVTGYFSS